MNNRVNEVKQDMYIPLNELKQFVYDEVSNVLISDECDEEAKLIFLNRMTHELISEASKLVDLSKVVMYATNSIYGPEIQQYILSAIQDIDDSLGEINNASQLLNGVK